MVDGIWLAYRTQALLAAVLLSFVLKNIFFLKIDYWSFVLEFSPRTFLVPKEVWSRRIAAGNQTWVLGKAECSQPLSQLSSPGVLVFAGTGCGRSGHFLCSLDIYQAKSI